MVQEHQLTRRWFDKIIDARVRRVHKQRLSNTQRAWGSCAVRGV